MDRLAILHRLSVKGVYVLFRDDLRAFFVLHYVQKQLLSRDLLLGLLRTLSIELVSIGPLECKLIYKGFLVAIVRLLRLHVVHHLTWVDCDNHAAAILAN